MHRTLKRTLATAAVLLLPLSSAGCTVHPGNTQAADTASEAAQQAPDAGQFPADKAKALSEALDRRAEELGTEFSAAVYEASTGRVWHYNPDGTYLEASLVKVPILLTLLRQATDEGRELTPEEEYLAVMMIEYSDNESTTALYQAVGGAEELSRTYELLGVNRTQAAEVWGANETGVEDQLQIARAVLEGVDWIDSNLHAVAIDLMENVDTGQSWGISAGLSETAADIALKNGWLQDDNLAWNVGSMGAVRAAGTEYAVVVLTAGTETMEGGVSAVEQVAGIINSFEAPESVRAEDTDSPMWRAEGR